MKTLMRSAIVLLFGSLVGCAAPVQETTATPVWKVSPGKPTYYINSVAVSADGGRVVGGTFYHDYGTSTAKRSEVVDERPADAGGRNAATATDPQDGTYGTYCFDGAGTPLWKDEFQGWQGVYWVDISKNGARAASGGWFSGSPSYAGFVRAYDAATGRILLDYRTTARVNQVVLSYDGTWLLAASSTLILFQYQNGGYVKVDEYSTGVASDSIVTADMSFSGQQIACGSYKGSLYAFANKGGKLTLLTPAWPLPSGGYSHSVRINPKGTAFAAGGSSGNFYLFDLATFPTTRKAAATGSAGSGSVYGVALSDDASTFAGIANVTGGKGRVYYCSGKTGASLWTFDTDHNPNCVSLNQGKGLMAVADGHPDNTPGAFYLINVATGKQLWRYDTTNMSWPIVISLNGAGIAAGSDDSYMYYFKP